MVAMKSPIDPFEGLVSEGVAGLGISEGGGASVEGRTTTGGVSASKRIDGSSAIIAINRPAQPG